MFFTGFLILFCVSQFSYDLSRMAGRVEVVRVLAYLSLRALLAAVSGEDVFVLFKVVVIVLVKEGFGHIYVLKM